MLRLILVSLLLLFFNFAFGSNILFHYCPYGKTHLLSFLPLMQQLSSDGHNVTVYYIDKEPPPNLGYNISIIQALIPRDEGNAAIMEMLWTKTGHGFLVPFVYYMQREGYNELLTKGNETYYETISRDFDLVIVDELFTLHGVGAADLIKQRRNIPYIIYSPTLQTYWYQSMIALSRNYVTSDSLFTTLPSERTGYFKPTKFLDRLISFSESYSEIFLMDLFVVPWTPFFFPGISMKRFFQEAHLSFGDHIDKLGNSVTVANDLVLVGSNCRSASKVINATLSTEWKTFIEDSTSKGTIYISFGSAVNWNYAPQKIRDAFIGAVNELKDYRIIFSWIGDLPENVKSHVRLTKWAPQAALLSHPKTKVFVTHGGLKSLKESLCAEVPIVVMPLLAEQAYNAKNCLKMGIGLVLNKYDISQEKIVNNILEVVNDKAYIAKVQKLRKIYLDRPIDPLQYGSYQITKLLRERKKFGAFTYDSAHDLLLRRKGRHMNNWEFNSIDIIFVMLGMIYLISQ